MRIEDHTNGDVLILTVRERRLDARSAPELKATIGGHVAGGVQWIVLDLGEVDFVDSSALGAIVSGLKLLGRSGDMVIAAAREPVVGLFRLTRMDKVFRLFESVAAAEQALASRV